MKSNSIKFCLLAGILLLITSVSDGQDFPRGTVIESVATLENKEQSYSLYLPAKYTPEKKWPVFYIFDPDGKGDQPVGIFKAAAEKYGFIIFGSNNNRNGLGSEIQTKLIKAFWKDTHARFAIDPQRTYAAGYSGGARLANNFAYSCKGCIAGVISCGAGFPPEFPLDKNLPYAIFGTAGFNDFNYPEMVRLDRSLGKLGVAHHLAKFDGGHDWLTEELAFAAIEWFNLQAMKTGRLAKDAAFIKDTLAKRGLEAEKLLKDGQFLDAYNKYDSLARDTAGLLINNPGITEKLNALAKDKDYKAALKVEEEQFARQAATVRRIILRAADLLDQTAKPGAAREISAEIAGMSELAKTREDSDERRLARRILRALLAESNESAAYIYMPQKDYKSAAANFELASLVRPENPYIEINLSRALVLDGRKKEALEALNRAVEKGFKDCNALARDEAFAPLQNNKDFQKLKAAISCIN